MNKIIYKYKIYGRNKGRKKNKLVNDIRIDDYLLNINQDVKKKNNLILDIGSGSGENALFLSKINSKSLIIACDVFKDGNINLCNKIYNSKITNIKLFSNNISKLLDQLKKKEYFNEIWILFPDPWPKKKHHKRRLINFEFLKKIHYLLKKNGKLFLTTDSKSYLFSILFNIYLAKKIYKWENDKPYSWIYNLEILPETKYYKKAIKSDKLPFFIKLIKI